MKFYKITLFVIVVILIMFISTTQVWADPNGNKGMFALTDEEADKQAQEQIKEQEEHKVTEVKSSDNYLTDLNVEGYTLTPTFDKQVIEYTIKEEINKSEINIKATTSNEKATVNGNGIVKIEEGKNEYRVDVTAENGSVRTYIIKLKAIEEKKQEQDEIINTEAIGTTSEIINTNNEQKANEENKTPNTMIYIVIGVVAVIIILVIISKKKSKNRKRRKH